MKIKIKTNDISFTQKLPKEKLFVEDNFASNDNRYKTEANFDGFQVFKNGKFIFSYKRSAHVVENLDLARFLIKEGFSN